MARICRNEKPVFFPAAVNIKYYLLSRRLVYFVYLAIQELVIKLGNNRCGDHSVECH